MAVISATEDGSRSISASELSFSDFDNHGIWAHLMDNPDPPHKKNNFIIITVFQHLEHLWCSLQSRFILLSMSYTRSNLMISSLAKFTSTKKNDKTQNALKLYSELQTSKLSCHSIKRKAVNSCYIKVLSSVSDMNPLESEISSLEYIKMVFSLKYQVCGFKSFELLLVIRQIYLVYVDKRHD